MDGGKNALPNRAALDVTLREQLVSPLSGLDRRVSTVPLQENVGGTQDIEIIDHAKNRIASRRTEQ